MLLYVHKIIALRTVRDGSPGRPPRLSYSSRALFDQFNQCCFTSTETIRTARDREPRTATSTFTQLLSSENYEGSYGRLYTSYCYKSTKHCRCLTVKVHHALPDKKKPLLSESLYTTTRLSSFTPTARAASWKTSGEGRFRGNNCVCGPTMMFR